MNKLRYALIIGISLLTSGCQMAILQPKGIIAADQKNLLITAVLLMLIIVIPVIILTFAIAWKYRASNLRAKYTPDWGHSTLLEIIWWAIPCVIIAILGTMTWTSSHRLDPYRPLDNATKPIIIQAVALDWKWLFIYPDQKIATINFAEIPVDVPVRFLITADAPMNSLEIPELAGQIYAMAGMQSKLNLMATEMGTFAGMSTNFSGPGFSDMRFKIKSTSQAEFDQWVTSIQQSSKAALTPEQYKQVALPSENDPVQYFAPVSPELFNQIMMKYMMPSSETKPMIETTHP